MATDKDAVIEVVVTAVADEAKDVRSFMLRPIDDAPLPDWAPGAHIDLSLSEEMTRSYSLIPGAEPGQYRIAVARDAHSRGCSSRLHDRVLPGDALRCSRPRNLFALADGAHHSVLIAGGIGITPILAMADRLAAQGRPWSLLYACRSRDRAPFVRELQELAGKSNASLSLWFDDERGGAPPDLAAVIAAAPADSQFYACGPKPMLDAFHQATATIAADRVHVEYFGGARTSPMHDGFRVVLGRSGRSVRVPPGATILDALIMNGIDVPYSCYEGVCGTCETAVLDGVPDHRDCLLTDSAKSSNKKIIICVSGSRSARLVLDL